MSTLSSPEIPSTTGLDNALTKLDARVQGMSERGTMFTTALGRLEVLRTTSGVGGYDGWAPRAKTIALQGGVSIRYAHPADTLDWPKAPT